MKKEKDRNQKIDRFILGQMPEEEVITFKKQLRDDPSLQKEVALQEKIIQGLKAHRNQELKTKLKAIHQEVTGSPKQRKLVVWWRYAAAAASILLIGAIAYWMFIPTPNYAALYQANYEPFNMGGNRSDTNQLLLIKARDLYITQQYKAALPMLETLAQESTDSLNYQLALSICHMELGQLSEAHQLLEIIIAAEDVLFSDQARWYLALLHLRQNRKTEAKTLLNKLAQNAEADYHQKAIELLKAL